MDFLLGRARLAPMGWRVFLFCFYSLALSACGPLGAGGEGTSLRNPFVRLGSVLKVDHLTSGTEQYYGRALIREGIDFYGATLSFQLKKQASQGAYFANFRLLRMVKLNGMTAVSPTLTTPYTLGLSGAFNLALNAMVIQDPSSRQVSFDLNFSANPYVQSISAGTLLVSDDFRSLVGGDRNHFFLIAQKASSLPPVNAADFVTDWSVVDFKVTSVGSLQMGVNQVLRSLGTGGLGYTAFRLSGHGALRAGEFSLVDGATGFFPFSLDSNPSESGTPRGNGGVDGAFVLSPDKTLIMGYDLRQDLYFAGGN